MQEMGVQAVQLLLARIQDSARPPQTVVLAPHLTVRGSERLREGVR
jgi:DNA-binding LacI/PurR family transcriptional regulator